MSELNRLRWQCRRGTLELDIILQRFLAQHYASLTPPARRDFAQLLENGDEELWALIDGQVSAATRAAQSLIDKLRAC